MDHKIPSKTSDLLNDSGYAKNEDVIALNKHLGHLSLSVNDNFVIHIRFRRTK